MISSAIIITDLIIISRLKDGAARNNFRFSSPLKKSRKATGLRARNLSRHKYIYGYDFDIAKRTTLYFIASGNIVDSSTSPSEESILR